MPKNKDRKRLVRNRMQKTGESYTTALSHLSSKKEAAPDYSALTQMSDDAVAAKTGRTWPEWVSWLDSRKASGLPHAEIAKLVKNEGEITMWWAQTVTVGYERIKGLREIGQHADGGYAANKSKTVRVGVSKLYQAFSHSRQRRRWLPDVEWTVRTSTANKSMRVVLADGSALDLYFTAKDENKSQVSLQHRKLADKAAVEEMKMFWSERFAELAESLNAS